MSDNVLVIDDSLSIPAGELTYRASRSGGPGGQHVNTSSTRVELTWDVAGSPSLSEDQRAFIVEKLAGRIDGAGVLRLTEGGSRSQLRNRESVTARFQELVAGALYRAPPRRPTRPPRSAKERLHAE